MGYVAGEAAFVPQEAVCLMHPLNGLALHLLSRLARLCLEGTALLPDSELK